jgi:hypothetical protein
MTIYKVSYVIIGNDNPGAIMNQEQMPVKGETVCIRNELFEVLEVLELVPPRGDFCFIHVTCKKVPEEKS